MLVVVVVVVVVVLLFVLLFLLFYHFFIIRFSGVAVDRVPVILGKYPHCTPITLWIDAVTVRAIGVPNLVKYPHCTPITPSRRTKSWKDAAPVPDLTLPRPE